VSIRTARRTNRSASIRTASKVGLGLGLVFAKIRIVYAYSAKIVYHNAAPHLTRSPRSHRIFLTYSLLAQFKMGATKRMNLRHLVTCRTYILWLMYTARRTNSNEVSNCLFVRRAVPIDADAVRIATALTFRIVSIVENARSSKNWIGPIQNFPAEMDRRFSTDSVLTAGGRHYQLASGLLPLLLLLQRL